ncbi:allophanate hydrolase [Roseospira navarrensis]|uniref:Allophanate hydrolase n=1 Tax=Roseospira navarrensis TaxID=140058 RepID=A0A7X1ZDI4_9PROT|nr:allophanate hydrolase [Roseospira navarrensis]MQX36348.1 allophanate hydrolase [Roseospira navarrensis]
MSGFDMTVRGVLAAASPVAAVRAAFARIRAYQAVDPAVWVALVPEHEALAAAEALEAAGPEGKPLYGVPFAVKDNIDTAGLPTTAACPVYAYLPNEDAPVVARLKAAGAILIGRTNMDQFATGLVGTRSPHGAPRCVFDRDYVSGGSSSGSAVAVAAGLVAFALGTDTAGSGRVPAAFNNLVGIKPSKGLLSTRGVVPACASLDCVTVFAHDVADADRVRRVAEGFDPADPWSRVAAPVPLPPHPRMGVLAPADRDVKGDHAAAALYDAAIDRARALGWEIVAFDYRPFQAAAALLYAGPWVAEREAAVGDFIRAHEDACDPTVAGIILGGGGRSARDAFDGLHRLAALKRETEAQWAAMDAMLLPTAPTQYRVAEVEADPVALNANLGLYTNFVNLLDLAAVAVPAGFREGNGLPFGVTLIGPAFSDGALAALGDALHRTVAPDLAPFEGADGTVHLAVVGAHLTGQPLNHQLTGRGAALLRTTRTAPDYRLYALAGTTPAKPGLVRSPGVDGPGLEVEVWALSRAAFGAFTEEVPPPLAIGSVTLADGSRVKGFVCEPAGLEGAEEITHHGGWRAWRVTK